MTDVWGCLNERVPGILSPLLTLHPSQPEQSAKLSFCHTRIDGNCVPELVLCMPGCCTVLPFGVLGAGRVTLPRESQRKWMPFNPIPKSPSSAVVRNTMLDDTMVPEKIGLMCKWALLFNWSLLCTVIMKKQVWNSSGRGSEPAILGRLGWTSPLDTAEVLLEGLGPPSSKEKNLPLRVSQFLHQLLPETPAQCPGKRRERANVRTDLVWGPYACIAPFYCLETTYIVALHCHASAGASSCSH